MKTIDLVKQPAALSELIQFAALEPVLILASDGHQFILSEADDFEAEVEALRNSRRFQQFLDERMRSEASLPIEDVEAQVEAELARA